jgi:hypothetical protein
MLSSPLHRRSQDLQRGSFLQRGVVLSKIPDFHGQFKKKILVGGISRAISKIFFQWGSFAPPDPPAYAYALLLRLGDRRVTRDTPKTVNIYIYFD